MIKMNLAQMILKDNSLLELKITKTKCNTMNGLIFNQMKKARNGKVNLD